MSEISSNDSAPSLLAHLVAGSSQEELFATRGLAYLLKTASCNTALLGEMNKYADQHEHPFITNVQCRWVEEDGNQGNGRPYVTGYSDGKKRIIIEGKFWSDLTSNQPVAYLNSLAETSGKDIKNLYTVCIFVVPPSRQANLWGKIKDRIKNTPNFRLSEQDISAENADWNATRVSIEIGNEIDKRVVSVVLAITNWQCMLNILQYEAVQSTKDDIAQLRALCERQESSGFREFSEKWSRKIEQRYK